MYKGLIFNIQKFCLNDGPGIRTTVFFKGCPLRCAWCHNPESQNHSKEIMYYADKCKGCGECENLTVDSQNFICFSGAKEICGKVVSIDEVIAEVLKDVSFYKKSGGGITLSGGEPLFQFDFVIALLKKSKESNLHTAIETCGFANREQVREIAKYVDLFLFDFKEFDAKLHKSYTGVDNSIILENLSLISELKKKIVLRCPIINGYNDREEHYKKISELANLYESISQIEIIPYHSFGESKYTALGKERPLIKMESEKQINKIIEYVSSRTKKPVKIV